MTQRILEFLELKKLVPRFLEFLLYRAQLFVVMPEYLIPVLLLTFATRNRNGGIDEGWRKMTVTPEDIEKSLRHWAPKLGYPEKEVDKAVTSFMYKITDEKISKDYEIAKSSSWTLRKWFDGDNFTERLRIYPDVKLLTIYEYGHKDTSFNKIVTYDGDMCLKMPSSLRAEIQAWYEHNPRQCRKELTAMLGDKFCNGSVDVNGEEHDLNSFFRSLKNRTVKPAKEFANVKKNMQQLLDLYPSQNDAKSWIMTSKDI